MFQICAYYENEIDSNSLTNFDFSIKIAKKMIENNIPNDYTGYGVIMKNENLSENIYLNVPKYLRYCYYSRGTCGYLSEDRLDNFKEMLGDAIIKNTLTENNKFVNEFLFKIGESEFLFTTIEDDAQKHTLFAFFPLNSYAHEMSEQYRKYSIINYISHVNCEDFRKAIANNCDFNELKKLYAGHKRIVKNVIDAFSKNVKYNSIKFVPYDGIRLEPNYIKAITKIAEYLGHGSYLGDMKQSVKKSISNHIFNEAQSADYSIVNGLELENTLVFYTGKGQENEKLIILS
jgi:hypothetical protein